MSIANQFAYFALFGWPAVCVALFLRLRVESAAICSLLGAYMLLPANLEVQVPYLPPLDKTSIAALTTFLLCWIKAPAMPARRPALVVYLLCAGFVFSPLLTSFDNNYELQIAGGSIPGFYPIDAFKYIGRHLIMLLPFFIAFRFLSTDYGRKLLLTSVPLAVLFYSPLMLFELRMSPQLHNWVYGYFPSSFAQQIRDSGFRPVVFLSHGLELALITSMALISALILARGRQRLARVPASAIAVYFSGLLLLCKSLGPTMYAFMLAPVIWLTRPRAWVKVACVILLVISVYPALRTAKLIPLNAVVSISDLVSADRSASFQMRVMNEEQLLAKANEKPLFGWGAWGRNRLYDEWTGRSTSVTDGGWIIVFGVWGWLGYLSTFVLFAACALRAHREIGRDSGPASVTLGGLCLLLTVYVLNMLPNATNMMLPLLLAGSIATSAKAAARQPVWRSSTTHVQAQAAPAT